ncbi:MAG: YitT family protein [Lachnospiraceae bacterium]|nr:YitT family protein [Lachnospiraceae bacterium]
MNVNKLRQVGIQLFCIFLGNVLIASGVAAFAIPHSMALVGVNGIARNMQYYLGFDMVVAIVCINGITFFLGLWMLGWKFALNTLVSTVIYPVLFGAFSGVEWLRNLTSDHLLAAVLAGFCFGGGMGIVMRVGGSSGGMDIPPLILNKKFGFPVAATINVVEVISLTLQMRYSNSNQILYGIVSAVITSFVLNQVLLYGEENIQVMVISKETEQINQIIQTDICRGSTLISIETGHLHEKQTAVLSVLSARELTQLNCCVKQIDETAFIIVTNAREVRGKGFTLAKS